METVEWNKKLEVNNFEIDSEHKLFVSIINKIIVSRKANKEKEYLESLLKELLKYAEFHFLSEENIMYEFGYPDLLEHKKSHDRVLSDLRNRIFSLKYEFIDFTNLEEFLIEWFLNHTSTEDLKLAEFINEQKKTD